MALEIVRESQGENQGEVSGSASGWEKGKEVYDAIRLGIIRHFLGDFQPRSGKRATLPATQGPHASRQWVTVLRDMTATGNLLN